MECMPRSRCIWEARESRFEAVRRVEEREIWEAVGVPLMGEVMLRFPRRESKLERREVVGEGNWTISLGYVACAMAKHRHTKEGRTAKTCGVGCVVGLGGGC